MFVRLFFRNVEACQKRLAVDLVLGQTQQFSAEFSALMQNFSHNGNDYFSKEFQL
jgi:hypothetical protein